MSEGRRISVHDWFNEQTIPIPIQTFLWQQTTPFIRPKLGKLHEASCTFCQNAPGHHEMKEACKAFEKVLVQNITSGLSKDLLDAIKSIPRWRLVQASFAHVIHCSAALLHNRKDTNLQTLGAAESKLLYILHWILLDAAEECADADYEKGIYHTSPFYYLFSIPSITLFIYMFAPLCHHIKESDLQTFRLENGLKIWQALWDYRHPEAPCFTAPCKPKPKVVWSKILKAPHHHSQFGDIFLGRKHSDGHEGFAGPGSPPSQSYYDPCSSGAGTGAKPSPSEEDGNWPISSPKDLNFPETIPEESSSVEEEHVMIYRLPSVSENDKPNRIYTAHPNSIFRMTVEKEDGYPPITKASLTIEQVASNSSDTIKSLPHHGSSHAAANSHSRSDLHRMASPPLTSPKPTSPPQDKGGKGERDMNTATFLDVAVLRCLFISQWPEEGVYWALQFIYHRLRDLNEEKVCQAQPRRRSNSLPIPKIEVSFYQSPELKLGRGAKDLSEMLEHRDCGLLAESPFYLRKGHPDEICAHYRRASERARKRLKLTDLRAYVEAKILSKSERNLLQTGTEEGREMKAGSRLSLDTGEDPGGLKCTRSNATSLARLMGQDSDERQATSLIKGNSMPSLRIGEERREGDSFLPRPIITVTQHTPMPSPEYNACPKGSIDSQLDTLSQPGGRCSQNSRQASLTRSHTDSNITYSSSESEVTEAPSSTPYITRDGDLDLRVVLMAVHDISQRSHISATLRVSEVVLNVLELIIDMGVLRLPPREDVFTPNAEGSRAPSPAFLDTVLSRPISMVINTVIRVLRHLGCPHGCGDGQRGPPGNFLRSQATSLLTKLKRVNPKLFCKFMKNMVQKYALHEILEFFHAYVGFCVDPNSLLSPLNQKRSCSKSPDAISQGGGYAANFGQSIGGSSGGGRGGVEGQIFSSTFKTLVTRFIRSAKELKTPENMAMYHDVRQLMQYVKEAHGGTFRRVVLSGLIDTAIKPHRKEPDIQTTRVVRHVPQTEQDDTIESSSPCYIVEERDNKKSLFKKRSTSSTCASLLDTDLTDDFGKPMQSPLGNLRKKQHSHVLTPRQSERNIGVPEHLIKGSKFGGIVSWFKKDHGRSESLDSHDGSDSPVESALVHQAAARLNHSYSKTSQHSGSSSGGHTVLTKAKRRVEDQLNKFGFGKRKRKDGTIEEAQGAYLSRRNSDDFGEHGRDSEFVVLKERRLVPIKPLFEGLQRFSFLLETCHPGSVPDSYLIGASLDLPNTPVISRAAFLLECCYFVHCCNKGTWPAWMKLNVPMFRPSGPLTGRGSTAPTGIRRSQFLQKSAGKMFYQWGEAIGIRLEELLAEDRQHIPEVITMLSDETKQKELLIEDEEEDFLDEAIENNYGADCPIALRMIACILLLEITAFLRETYQTLPKTSRSTRGPMGGPAFAPWEKFCPRTDRRCSVALSSMGYSQTSAQSLQSIADKDSAAQGERKISFVLHEPDNESEESSNNTVTCHNEEQPPLPAVTGADDKKKKGVAPPVTTPQQSQGRPILLRRGTTTTGVPSTGSFKRRSLKLRRGTKEAIVKESPNEYPDFKRTDSLQSKRKVSSLSDRSDTSEHADVVSGEESPGILSDDQPPESPSDSNDTDELSTSHLPWMKTMVQVAAAFNFYCSHQSFCHPFCYRRNMRACTRLVKAVRKVYGEEFGVVGSMDNKIISSDLFKKDIKCKSHKMSEHSSSQASPIKRKDSVSKKDRIDKNTVDGGSSKDSTKDGEVPDDSKQQPSKKKSEEKVRDSHPILKYLKSQVRDIFHAPIATLTKGSVVLTEDQFSDILPIAWELLLESNQELVATAAALFIVASVRAPTQASNLMHYQLQHHEAAVRISAIQRFQILWKLRYQVWPRMEENAHVTFKVPPPGIEFTLPSPKIGSESLPVVDPPWMPQVKTKVDEVQLSQESHRSLVTATKTRKKQQTELIKLAMKQREDKNRNEREHFLITTIPITKEAAYDPISLHAMGDPDHDEMADEEQADQAAPPQSQGQTQGQTRNTTTHHITSATALFPSSLCSSVITIINLLDDAAVSNDGIAVYDVAYQVIWNCLVEESSLFLRYILERLTREKQDVMFKVLRHLIRFVPKLPQQAAFALYNYIIGYVMFYVRSPHGEGQKMIGAGLSILWMVVHSVNGIMFKDLKQILRKEQCDASILLTANVPSTKKIIVHGPQEMDDGGIPSQFPVQEETQFLAILREALDFFGIDEEKHAEYFLVDHKTRQIHNPVSYVRDYYFFKRSQYPQLKLVHLKTDEAFNALQQQELLHKFIEIGKVLLTWAILKNVDMVVQRVVFLHEELMKLPSFPRKALDTDLDLYKGGIMGRELLGLDVLHKFMWVRLIARMFEAMAGNFAYSGDIHLFLNVLNGAVTLHSEDACILRYVMATYINAAHNFKNIFSTNGYLLIIPSLLQLYASHQTNKLVARTVEYTVKQFYLMNRKPFILQMFGSASAILDTDDDSQFGDAHKVPARCLFNLLLSLETPSPDPLNIGELVKEEKPLKAIDFCYHDENEMVTVLDCISLCVMVVAYAADSLRAYQMLVILEAILPCYLKQIQYPLYTREGKTEREIIVQLAVAIKTLVNNCEALAKNYSGPTLRQSPEHKGSSQRNYSRGGPYSPGFDFDEDSHSKYVTDRNRNKGMHDHIEDLEKLRNEFRRPRDVLLNLVSEFVKTCNARLIELNKKFPQDGKSVELLDLRSNIRLAEVAHSLLKVSPYDPETMACKGLQNYMISLMPSTDWSTEALKPTLLMILRRLEKMFVKIFKKPPIRRHTDWEAAGGLIKGIHETLSRHPSIVQLQPLKLLITTCQSLIIGELGSSSGGIAENFSSATHALMAQVPPPHFCASVVRLIALQIIAMEFCYHQDSFTLEYVCGNTTVFVSPEKTESMLMNFLMPLCLRVGSGRKEINCMRQADITFTLTCVLNAILPPVTKTTVPVVNQNLKTEMRTSSVTFTVRSDVKSLYQVGFLALKIVIVCFESEMTIHWPRIARTIKEVNKMNEARLFLWNFLEFVVAQRSPLYVLLQPFIHQKLLQTPYSDQERHYQFIIRENMFGLAIPKCRAALLTELIAEMKKLKEELEDKKYAEQCNQKNNLEHTTIEITQPRQYHRPSIIDLLTGGHPPSHPHPPPPIPVATTQAPPPRGLLDQTDNENSHRESVSSLQDVTTYLQNFTNNNVVNNNQHQTDNDNNNDTTSDVNDNVENLSPTEDNVPHELMRGKSKLQRTKAQSKKTFMLRKSRKEAQRPKAATLSTTSTPLHGVDLSSASEDMNGNHGNLDTPPETTPPHITRSPISGHSEELTNGTSRPDASWCDEDLSLMSQTSSTSGYRENCSLLLMPTFETCSSPPSPEGTQRFYPSTSSSTVIQVDNISEHSLIISYQHHDEDSLI